MRCPRFLSARGGHEAEPLHAGRYAGGHPGPVPWAWGPQLPKAHRWVPRSLGGPGLNPQRVVGVLVTVLGSWGNKGSTDVQALTYPKVRAATEGKAAVGGILRGLV